MIGIGWVSRTAAVGVAVVMLASGCTKTSTRIDVTDGPVGQGNGISPVAVNVQRNADVELQITNTGTKTHGFSIDGYGVTREIPQGQTITVSFTARQSGTFRIFCQLHPAHATSELIVN